MELHSTRRGASMGAASTRPLPIGLPNLCQSDDDDDDVQILGKLQNEAKRIFINLYIHDQASGIIKKNLRYNHTMAVTGNSLSKRWMSETKLFFLDLSSVTNQRFGIYGHGLKVGLFEKSNIRIFPLRYLYNPAI